MRGKREPFSAQHQPSKGWDTLEDWWTAGERMCAVRERRGHVFGQRKAESARQFVLGLGQGLLRHMRANTHLSGVESWEGRKEGNGRKITII